MKHSTSYIGFQSIIFGNDNTNLHLEHLKTS